MFMQLEGGGRGGIKIALTSWICCVLAVSMKIGSQRLARWFTLSSIKDIAHELLDKLTSSSQRRVPCLSLCMKLQSERGLAIDLARLVMALRNSVSPLCSAINAGDIGTGDAFEAVAVRH